jgi:hypothetical protein
MYREVSTAGTPATNLLLTNTLIPFKNINIEKIEGYYAGTDKAWLQLHDAVTVPANGATPLRSLFLGNTVPNGFLWQYSADELCYKNLTNGLIAVLSTTEATLTVATGGDLADMWFGLENWELEQLRGNPTVLGDTTTTRKLLTVWVNASGPKRLLKIEATNAINATTTRIQVFAVTAPANGTIPFWDQPIGVSASVVTPAYWDLGSETGIVPLNQTQANPPVLQVACVIAASTTAGSLTAPAGNDVTIRATFNGF